MNKINVLIHGGETLFESEWVQLADFFQVQWQESLRNIITILSASDQDSQMFVSCDVPDDIFINQMVVDEVYNSTQKWLTATMDSFENENSNIIEQVCLLSI